MYTLLKKNCTTLEFKAIEQSFFDSMYWWEKAINYYFKTGLKLKKD
jgi:hypothetical protein